jgi:hypothetical protein
MDDDFGVLLMKALLLIALVPIILVSGVFLIASTAFYIERSSNDKRIEQCLDIDQNYEKCYNLIVMGR